MVTEFTNRSMDVFRAGTGKSVDEVRTCTAILTRIAGALVNICKIRNKYMPRTVLCEKMSGSFENCLIFFFRTEVFEAFIKLKTLHLNSIGDLPETVRF